LEEIRAKGVIDVKRFDWMLDYSVGQDPLIYIERGGLIPVENPPKTHPLSFPRVWMSWDRVWTLLDSDWRKSEVPTGIGSFSLAKVGTSDRGSELLAG
jgi:hypothetical protein